MEQWRSINQIAKELNIPETTARRYFDTFKDFLHGKKFGQVIKYPSESLKIIDTIYMRYKEGKTTEEIRTLLKEQFQQVIEVQPKEEPGQQITLSHKDFYNLMETQNKAIIEAITRAIEGNTEALKQVADQAKQIEELKEEIKKLKEERKPSMLQRLFNKKM